MQQNTIGIKENLYPAGREMHRINWPTFNPHTILEYAGAIIITVDLNGIIQTFNPKAEMELGYEAGELVGKYTPLIFYDPSLFNKRAKQLTAELKTNIPADMEILLAKARMGLSTDEEWVYIRKDGTKFTVQHNFAALKDEQGNITGFIEIALNITQRKKSVQELRHALKKEKELSCLKSRFVSMASHEFRTPLSTILSSAYLIEKYTDADGQCKREKHLKRIISAVSSLNDILNDFLSAGKIEEGKIQVRPSAFNIQELVIGIAGEMKNTLKKKQKIHYNHEGPDIVFLDASLLKHIILNLISNAGKFSPEASHIEIKTINRIQHLILTVKDEGIGIPKEDQKHLMTQFYRAHNAINIQGTGLGLHIVSKYTELLNGIIKCKSELQKGTTFTIIFNLKTEDNEDYITDRRQ